MKILVGIKRVIDYNVRVRVRDDLTDVDLANTKMSINPFCEIAVEEALRLREQGVATDIVAVTIGPQAAQEQLRMALALGVDRAIHIVDEQPLDSLDVARVLAHIVAEQQPDLVLLGKQAIDSDNNQTGQMLAGLCQMGQATFASSVTVDAASHSVTVTREVDGGHRTLQLPLPAVVTSDLRLNEPRHARLPDIMKAKKKPIDTRPLSELGIARSDWLSLERVEAPQHARKQQRLSSVEELVAILAQSTEAQA